MPIARTGPEAARGFSVNRKMKCEACGERASVLVYNAANNKSVCSACSPHLHEDLVEVVSSGKTPSAR